MCGIRCCKAALIIMVITVLSDNMRVVKDVNANTWFWHVAGWEKHVNLGHTCCSKPGMSRTENSVWYKGPARVMSCRKRPMFFFTLVSQWFKMMYCNMSFSKTEWLGVSTAQEEGLPCSKWEGMVAEVSIAVKEGCRRILDVCLVSQCAAWLIC